MNNTVWDSDFIYNGQESVRVSCHSGDFGMRALCNLVGDQPLFYIEDSAEEDIALEDLLLEEFMSDRDEKIIADMRKKISMYDRSAVSLNKIDNTLPEEAFDSVFTSVPQKNSLDDIINLGSKSGVFKSYYQFISDKNIEISFNQETPTSFYDKNANKIYLNKNLDIYGALTNLIQSMRLAWLSYQGALINPLVFYPEDAVLINRIIEADQAVIVTALLWDMKLAGEEALWNRAMNGSNYDLCAAYAMEAMTDFRSMKSGLAARATFEKWFLSGRCKSVDRQIIQIMLGKHTDLVIGGKETSHLIAADLISALGAQIEGKNYLSSIVHQIMEDSLFCEVRDRSNANFLWFVSFERRMAEMEQELQGDDKAQQPKKQDNVVSLSSQARSIQSVIEENSIASVFVLDHFRAG